MLNTPTGGYRQDARDLIFIATRGNVFRRQRVQHQVKLLKQKGVAVAVLDVGYKEPVQDYQNVLQDLASSPREVHPLDFKRISMTAQSLVFVKCEAKEKKGKLKMLYPNFCNFSYISRLILLVCINSYIGIY